MCRIDPNGTCAPKPEVQQLLDQLAALEGPPLRKQTVEAARQGLRELTALRGEDLPLGSVTDVTIPGPEGASRPCVRARGRGSGTAGAHLAARRRLDHR